MASACTNNGSATIYIRRLKKHGAVTLMTSDDNKHTHRDVADSANVVL
jgi:hypothetical protein